MEFHQLLKSNAEPGEPSDGPKSRIGRCLIATFLPRLGDRGLSHRQQSPRWILDTIPSTRIAIQVAVCFAFRE